MSARRQPAQGRGDARLRRRRSTSRRPSTRLRHERLLADHRGERAHLRAAVRRSARDRRPGDGRARDRRGRARRRPDRLPDRRRRADRRHRDGGRHAASSESSPSSRPRSRPGSRRARASTSSCSRRPRTASRRRSPASSTWRSAASGVDEVVLVTEEEIAAAMRFLYGRAKLACEPSGAAATAALLAGKIAVEPGSTVVADRLGRQCRPRKSASAILAEADES